MKKTCVYHPDYNIMDGEPTGRVGCIENENEILELADSNNIDKTVNIPCPYCWQMYAEYQRYRATRYNSLNNSLEIQLATASLLLTSMDLYARSIAKVVAKLTYFESPIAEKVQNFLKGGD